MMEHTYIKLSDTERAILDSYCAFAEELGSCMGEACKITIHSLENPEHAILHTGGGTHATDGESDPHTALTRQMLPTIKSGPRPILYEQSQDNSGAPVKTAAIPLPGENQRTIGLLCIDFYSRQPLPGVADRLFSHNPGALISQSLAAARETVCKDPCVSPNNRNKEIIAILYKKGIFNLKDSVVKVAELLHLSKNTVYMHIRNLDMPHSPKIRED